ncbi:peptidoglycan recognition protein family protein [Pseudonocardia sichuanensis]
MPPVQIIGREDWGARYEDGFGDAPLPATRLYLHHSVTIAPDLAPPFIDDDAAIRTLEQIGEDRFGRGISYTFAITPVGRIYEGHGIGRQGAHTKGLNSMSRAICWVGNYESQKPTPQMVDATVRLVRHGHAQGWWPARFAGGHRDAPGASTACPGRHAYALIGDMNLRAAAPAPPEDDMPLSQDDLRQIREVVHAEIAAVRGLVWDAPIPDYFQPLDPQTGKPPTMPAYAGLGWGITHAAYARRSAEQAVRRADELVDGVAAGIATQRGGAPDYDEFIRTFAAELIKRLSAEEGPTS